ncbi:esterase-like activity of phytase family protein (plasmid) [Streptomyces sp. HUAS TT11]|uniref:esterase-like activity of phytase family protein n=1 Tax=Streptomyces sp. HUAS TT11 TaxID=3447508 RepID=UPI003F65C31D
MSTPAIESETNACSAWATIDWFSDALDKTFFEERFVGNFSGLAVTPEGYIAALSDRSVLFHLDPSTHEPVRVIEVFDEDGEAVDFEGIVYDHDGTFLAASEEPAIRRYTPEGKPLSRLQVPARLMLAKKTRTGRAGLNDCFEGLTILPDSLTLVASMEASLKGDDVSYVRFQTWERDALDEEFEIGAQWAYQRDEGLSLSEISAVGDGRLLVLERGFEKSIGNIVRLYLADPRDADDVTEVEILHGQDGVRAIGKTLLVDLVNCPPLGATNKQPQENPLLGNVEGLAITESLPDGRLKILMATDDNQSDTQITRLYGMTIRLPEF